MKSQMAACRLAARRLDELFDKYGRDTMLAAIDADLRRDRAEVPQRGGAASRRRLRGRSPRSTTTASIKGEPVPIHVKVTVKGSDMTIDLSRLLGRAQGRDQLAHAMPARASPTRR